MKKVIVQITPFTFKQNVYVYEDNNKIKAFKYNLNEMPEALLALSNKESIEKISFIGSKIFAKNISSKIENLKQTKYQNSKDIIIEIL